MEIANKSVIVNLSENVISRLRLLNKISKCQRNRLNRGKTEHIAMNLEAAITSDLTVNKVNQLKMRLHAHDRWQGSKIVPENPLWENNPCMNSIETPFKRLKSQPANTAESHIFTLFSAGACFLWLEEVDITNYDWLNERRRTDMRLSLLTEFNSRKRKECGLIWVWIAELLSRFSLPYAKA